MSTLNNTGAATAQLIYDKFMDKSTDSSVLVEHIAELHKHIESLEARLNKAEHLTAASISSNTIPMVAGHPMVLSGDGSPSTTTLNNYYGQPSFVGQIYIDITAKKVYIGTGVTNSADWQILN